MDVIRPDWPAPPRVQALVTTRELGDMGGAGRAALGALLPAAPRWLRQVHGTSVVDVDRAKQERPEGDAAVARRPASVCAVMAADCLPVLLADEAGSVVGAAHAGWRGLCAGVIEATVGAMRVEPARMLAWLGPAIGPRAYEVGEEVRAAFLQRDAAASSAFVPARPGHWLLDLYAVARQRLAKLGVGKVCGGGLCTYSEPGRFYSFRRDGAKERMAALIWLA